MSSSDKTDLSSKKTFLNSHNVMLFFAVVFLIIALVGLIALSGAQTGSSETSGVGSLVISSTGGQVNGEINPTAEVISEFFIILFTVLGIAMLTYVILTKKYATDLLNKGHLAAAMIINGNKSITEKDLKEADVEDLKRLVVDVGLPSNTLSLGAAAAKNGYRSVKDFSKRVAKGGKDSYNKLKDTYNIKAKAPDGDSNNDDNDDNDKDQ